MKVVSHRGMLLLGSMVLGLSSPLLAQSAAPATAPAATPAAPAEAAPAAPEPGRDPGTTALNRDQAASATSQNAENRANAREYRAELRNFSQEVGAAEAARQRYEADLAAYNATVARQREEHEAAMARWREDTAACQRGVRARCAPPAAATPRN